MSKSMPRAEEKSPVGASRPPRGSGAVPQPPKVFVPFAAGLLFAATSFQSISCQDWHPLGLDISEHDKDKCPGSGLKCDLDRDGYFDRADSEDEEYDCDDRDPLIHPRAKEDCDGIDNDCDQDREGGGIDEGLSRSTECYRDADQDGYGRTEDAAALCACDNVNYVPRSGDCEDGMPEVHPNAREECNHMDDDCDTAIDEGLDCTYEDKDGDGYGSTNGYVVAGHPSLSDGGLAINRDDCNDKDPNIHPEALETCNSRDDNCNNTVDENPVGAGVEIFYMDSDHDGQGDADSAIKSCNEPEGFSPNDWDCDDDSADIHLGATEIPDDGIDEDCDGSELYRITQAVAGGAFSLVLRSDGTVWSWGDNGSGQLGCGCEVGCAPGPVKVEMLADITAISAGNGHALAIDHNGTLYAWGANTFGQLGDGTRDNRSAPVIVEALQGIGVVAMAAGGYHSLAVTSDSTRQVWAWGDNSCGQLGDGTAQTCVPEDNVYSRLPTRSELRGVSTISAGLYHSLAVDTSHAVWGWGSNRHRQIGIEGSALSSIPQKMLHLVAGQISAGSEHSVASAKLASDEDTSVDQSPYCWGSNEDNQLGVTLEAESPNSVGSGMICTSEPQLVEISGEPSQIAAGYTHTLVQFKDGTYYAWGSNERGELGLGEGYNCTGVCRGLLSNLKMISAGRNFSIAVDIEDSVFTWGENSQCQTGKCPSTTTDTYYATPQKVAIPLTEELD